MNHYIAYPPNSKLKTYPPFLLRKDLILNQQNVKTNDKCRSCVQDHKYIFGTEEYI